MSQPTQGPWIYDPEEAVIFDTDGNEVMVIFIDAEMDDSREEQLHVDARLGAASWTMLDLLRGVVAAQDEASDGMRDRKLDEVDLQIRQLIAEIGGQS